MWCLFRPPLMGAKCHEIQAGSKNMQSILYVNSSGELCYKSSFFQLEVVITGIQKTYNLLHFSGTCKQ